MSEVATRNEGPDEMIGKVFDERYRIEAPLGQGGIGRVYKARHLTLGRMVALKVLLTQYEAIPVLKQRFAREAEALAALSHPNIVTVTDFGVADHNPYIVMELLEGKDLAELLSDGVPLEPKRAFDIVRQSLRALDYAHERGLVHRDLKPHNIFVRPLGDGSDHVTVLDFGLARFVGEAAKSAPKLTRQGALIGTPAYMAPEQASGEEVDARADVYAMGCVLFEALTGSRVFPTSDPGEILRSHLLKAPPSLAAMDPGLVCTDALEAYVARTLEKSPAARFQTVREMLAELDALGPDAARRVGPRPSQPGVSALAPTQQPGPAPTRAGTPAAKSEREPVARPHGGASSVALPTSKAPLLLGLGCAGLALVAAVALGGWLMMEPDPPPAPVVEPTPPEPVPDPAPEPPPAPAPTDPFDDVLPEALAPIHDAQVRGRTFREPANYWGGAQGRYRNQLLDFIRTAGPETEWLGQLVYAHVLADKRALSDSLSKYQEAWRANPRARYDAQMLPDLVEMACTQTASSRGLRAAANELILSAYGADARPELEAWIARGRSRNCPDPANLERLLERLPPP